MKKLLTIVALLLLVTTACEGTTVYDGNPVGSETFSGTSDGIAVTSSIGNAPSGDTVAVTVGATQTYKVMRFDFTPEADVTGIVNVVLGTTTIYNAVNPTGGSVYGFNMIPNFIEGAVGEDLIVNAPASAAISYNAHGVLE